MDGHGESTGEAGFIDRSVAASEQYLKHDDELLVGGKEWKSQQRKTLFLRARRSGKFGGVP